MCGISPGDCQIGQPVTPMQLADTLLLLDPAAAEKRALGPDMCAGQTAQTFRRQAPAHLLRHLDGHRDLERVGSLHIPGGRMLQAGHPLV